MSKVKKAIQFHAKKRSLEALTKKKKEVESILKSGAVMRVNKKNPKEKPIRHELSVAERDKYRLVHETIKSDIYETKNALGEKKYQYQAVLKAGIENARNERVKMKNRLTQKKLNIILELLEKAKSQKVEDYEKLAQMCRSNDKGDIDLKKLVLKLIKGINGRRPITSIDKDVLEGVIKTFRNNN
ncbi:MAG: hypothetical protein KF721_15185 [Ignavibacteriaceae bacterium]|nr:hypothetical protein [Ignavibacteriaceae bacterium]